MVRPIPLLLRALLAALLAGCLEPPPEAAAEPATEEEAATSFALNPGAEARPPALAAALDAAWVARAPGYEPRTRHLQEEGVPKHMNRLFLESSPYLLQHAHNPVDWHPWADEAFASAKRLNRPVLLSVGYSTCHWCHVMEEESFEDEEIAAFLNANYICIKVDREELPDVDAVYMAAVYAIRKRGGWPMNVFLTPDREPFFGGTYFPPRDGARGNRPGFLTVLRNIHRSWTDNPAGIAGRAEKLTAAVRQRLAPTQLMPQGAVGPKTLESASGFVARSFDAVHKGMTSRSSKFPSQTPIRFLLREGKRAGDTGARGYARETLTAMAAGGIHDQVGGGFHRYSVDARWLVPHFEKMLYDNALLVVAYVEGWQATGDPVLLDVARTTLDYVEREMLAPGGAFYSATDADSANPEGHREEGWFFTWTPAEMAALLPPDDVALARTVWGVGDRPNFEGRFIFSLPQPLASHVPALAPDIATLSRRLDGIKTTLYASRATRPPPLRDDKVITAWSSLMIEAFARYAQAVGSEHHAQIAARAADFLLSEMRTDGRLLRSWKDGRPGKSGVLDDYAFLCQALLDLFEVTGEARWLEEAIALDATIATVFEDTERGGWFLVSNDRTDLLAREKPDRDGAEPSGASVHLLNLLRLHEWTTNPAYAARADAAMTSYAPVLTRAPLSLSEMLMAVDWTLDRPDEIVIVVPDRAKDEAVAKWTRALGARFLPNKVAVVLREGQLSAASGLVPWLNGKKARGGSITAYVCEQGVCELPADTVAAFEAQLATR